MDTFHILDEFVQQNDRGVQAGSAKAVNVVLIGLMAKNTDIPYEKWIETIKTTVPEKFLEVNLQAFELGYNA